MTLPNAVIWAVVALLVLALGLAVATQTRFGSNLWSDLKRDVRVALDLPKDWTGLERRPSPEGREVVECPRDALVIGVGGQSNAGNSNPEPDPREPSPKVLSFHQGACTIARSPLLGSSGTGSSVWPALGDALAAETGRTVVLVAGAVGGTEFTDWLDRRSGYLDAFEAGLRGAAEAGLPPRMVLWHQGETDAVVSSGVEESTKKLTALTDALLEAAPEATLYLFRASRCRRGEEGGEPVPFLVEAQTRVAEASDRIVLGMDTDVLGEDHRWDGCHFNFVGREAIARQVSKDLVALLDEKA